MFLFCARSGGDVVSVERLGDELHFKEVVRPSGHSVIRIIVYDSSKVAEMHGNLKKWSVTLSKVTFQVCLPSIVRPQRICEEFALFWKEGERDDRWTYAEASIREATTV